MGRSRRGGAEAILGHIAYIVLAVGIIALNAMFVAAEFAFVKLRATQVAAAERRRDHRARFARHVLDRLDIYLSACQVGITLTSLGLGWVGEPAFAATLKPLFEVAGITSPAVLHTVAFIAGFTLATVLHVTLGELVPKFVAIRDAERTALSTALPLIIFYRAFQPLVWSLNAMADGICRVAGLGRRVEAHSEEELRLLLSQSEKTLHLSGAAGKLLINVLDLRRLLVRDIMVPRSRMVCLDASVPAGRNLEILEQSGFTRYPLIDGHPDSVLGTIHAKDIWRARSGGGDVDLRVLRRRALFIPETSTVERLLQTFLGSRTHIAVVVDEYGTTTGLVTLEDVLEEIVGEIRDEFDDETSPALRVGEGEYVIDALTSLSDLGEITGIELRAPGITTLGGLIVDRLGRLPREGERVVVDGILMEVRRVGRRRIHQVYMKIPAPSAPAGGGGANTE